MPKKYNKIPNGLTKELEESYNELRIIKIKYDALYEYTTNLCRTINADGKILDCNKSYAETLGYSKQEIIGKSIFEHAHKDSLDELHKSFEKWKKDGKVGNIRIWLKKKDGSIFPVKLFATSLFDDKDKLIGSNTVLIDISEIYALQQINKYLAEHEKISKEVFDSMSHELRTPIVTIKAYTDMLYKGNFGDITPEQKEKLERIKKNIDLLIVAIFKMLEKSKKLQ